MPQNNTPFLGQPCGDPVGGLDKSKGEYGYFEILSVDASGNLNVNVVSGGGNAAAGPTGQPVPADADYIGINVNGLLVGVSESNPLPVYTVTAPSTASHFAWDTGPTPIVVPSGTLLPLLSIRPKATATTITFFLTGSDISIFPAIGEWQLIKNGVLTGASFTDVPNSNAQEDTSATLVSGGTVVDSGYSQNGTRSLTYSLGFSTITDTYTLACQRQLGAIPNAASGALRWTEQ